MSSFAGPLFACEGFGKKGGGEKRILEMTAFRH